MGRLFVVVLLSLLSVVSAIGNPGEPMMFLQQLQPQHISPFEMRPVSLPVHPQFQPISRSVPFEYRMIPQEQVMLQDQLQPIIHINPRIPETMIENQSFNEFPEQQRAAEENSATAKSGYDYPSHPQTYPQTPGYGYTAPAANYSPSPAPAAPTYSPPAHHEPTSKFNILKPDITSLIKPVTTKVATKVSGLIGLILSLLTGSAPDDLEMKGFKDIVINGIVKPLLIAKGGIKSLISKLTIPVISLLLINLEVLITVWWLWEECPDPVKHVYTKPTYPANYNSY